MQPEPETYYLRPTRFVPNSKLPVLLYRGVLGNSPTPESIRSLIEPNKWIRGGQWKTYPTAHFHSISHECYAVFQGKSTFRLGKSPLDPDTYEDGDPLGHDVLLERGDIIVLPAGVSHHSIDSEDDFEYVGLYPIGSPHWDNNWCKASHEETQEKAEQARKVPIPQHDPILGFDGHLPKLWNRSLASAETTEDKMEGGQAGTG